MIMRKVHEAFFINNLKPQINYKDKCISAKRFSFMFWITEDENKFKDYTQENHNLVILKG